MNDRLLMDNILLLLKSTVEVYVHGSLESTNKLVHNVLKSNLDAIIKMQDETYKEMTNNGWYVVENIQAKEISKALKKLTQNKNS